MDVAHLLDLEGRLQRERVARPPPDHEQVLPEPDALGNPSDQVPPAVRQHPCDLVGGLLHQPGARLGRPRQLVGREQEDRKLGREALGRQDAALGAGLQRYHVVGQAPETGPLDVDQRGDAGPASAGRPDRVDDVDGLAALGDGQHQRALGHEVCEVGELRAGDEGDPAAGDPRQEVLGGEGGVAGAPAAHREDIARLAQHGGEAPRVPAMAGADAPQHRGLLVDLLGHEVGIAGQVGRRRFPLHLGDLGAELPAGVDVEEADGLPGDQHGPAIVDKGDPARVLDQRGIVGGEQIAAVAPAHHERRAALDGDELSGAHVEDGDGVQPVEAPEGRDHGADELLGARRRPGEAVLDEVGDHLGVGLRVEPVSGADQRVA